MAGVAIIFSSLVPAKEQAKKYDRSILAAEW
jgi:hypothetical protein